MGRGSIKGITALPGYGGGSQRDERSTLAPSVVGDEDNEESAYHVHGYLAPYRGTSLIRNRPPPLGPPYVPRHSPSVGS